MPEVLDPCFWPSHESTPANLSPNRSLAVDLLRPFRRLWLDTKHLFGRGPGATTDESRDIRQHSTDYPNLLAAGDAYLADPSINFLFLPMPIPHPVRFQSPPYRAITKPPPTSPPGTGGKNTLCCVWFCVALLIDKYTEPTWSLTLWRAKPLV